MRYRAFVQIVELDPETGAALDGGDEYTASRRVDHLDDAAEALRQLADAQAEAAVPTVIEEEEEPPPEKKKRKCGLCKKTGHQRRYCPENPEAEANRRETGRLLKQRRAAADELARRRGGE